MDREWIKHWAGTGLVAIAAGFVIFGLVFGQDFLKNFFKEQETRIELESELIESEEDSVENESSQNNVIPFREAVILSTPLATPAISLTVSPTQIPTITATSALLSSQEPSPAITPWPSPEPTSAPTPSSTPFYTPTPFPTSSPQATPVQQQAQSQCQTGQVDINSAPKEELLKIIHIGEARAGELISLRPFSSIDDMDRIKGIGPTRVQDIKNEGIACF